MIRLSIDTLLFLGGCATNEKAYYDSVNTRNAEYLKAYAEIKNESVTFKGRFDGDITIVKPKKMPNLQMVQAPKSSSDIALQWASVLAPSVVAIAGFKYNSDNVQVQAEASRDIAIAQSADNANIFGSYSGSFKNDNSVSTTDLSNITTDSISDYSDTITDTSTTTDTDTRTTTQVVPSVEVLDGNVTIN